jgi:uncharacterized protein YjbJ (UPF0337 family)
MAMGSKADKVYGKPNELTSKADQGAGKAVGNDESRSRT